MADVFFIYNDRSAHSGYSFGLGIASISAYLRKHGFSTDLLYCKTAADRDALLQRIADAEPTVVGFYGPSSGFSSLVEMSAAVRRAHPGLFQIYGGAHATLQPECLHAAPTLDAVCVGYGEEPTRLLLERLRDGRPVRDLSGLWLAEDDAGRRVVHRNPPWDWGDDADRYLGFDHDLFLRELRRYPDFSTSGRNLEVMLRRGCVYSCAFCSGRALRKAVGGHAFQPTPETSVRVIKEALGQTGMRRVTFHDDILTIDKPWFRELMERYRDEVGLPFTCNLRPGTFDEEDVRLLKEAGVDEAYVGLESGNDAIREKVMKKGTSRADLAESFRLLHKYGVTTVTQNIIGLPGETPAAFIDTIRMNAELDPTGSILSVFYPYPGTELERVCREQDLFSDRPPAAMLERLDTVLDLPGFSRRRILFYRKHFERFIKYEALRRKHPRLLPVPLTPTTAPALRLAFNLLVLRQLAHRRPAH